MSATAHTWAARYRELGEAGMVDRSSRPHSSPGRTPTCTERRIMQRACPAAVETGADRVPPRVDAHHRAPGPDPARHGPPGQLDQVTDLPVRRYERAPPRRTGALRHQETRQLPRGRRPPRH
ncbi:leucine zipper domain-containing protein [Actinokineospora spheciospongiae]|uniref:leucine zipper domain-containing protein n=1 Tax=Actinokineospora spheciospongiae TaxID=909613 RepID=UPI0039857852